MLSSTDSLARALVSWKVRTMPRRAMRWARMPEMSVPANAQLPESARSNPDRTLKKLDLPAPLGPIRAVMAPLCTSRWSTSTARRPPNRRHTASATSSGSGLATPGVGSIVSSTASAGIDQELLAFAEDALRPPHRQPDQGDPDQHVAQREHLVGGDEARDPAALDAVGEHTRHQLQQEPEQHGAHDRAAHAARAAQDDGGVH